MRRRSLQADLRDRACLVRAIVRGRCRRASVLAHRFTGGRGRSAGTRFNVEPVRALVAAARSAGDVAGDLRQHGHHRRRAPPTSGRRATPDDRARSMIGTSWNAKHPARRAPRGVASRSARSAFPMSMVTARHLDQCQSRHPQLRSFGHCRASRSRSYGEGEYMRDLPFSTTSSRRSAGARTAPHVRDGRHYVIARGRGASLTEAFVLVAEAALRFNRPPRRNPPRRGASAISIRSSGGILSAIRRLFPETDRMAAALRSQSRNSQITSVAR